jgi:hypothetical protein
LFFQAKQFGSILRGFGPPVPQAGVVGDVYIDVQTWQLFNKRATNDTDPWGHYLFVVPVTYRTALKFFSTSAPGDDIGIARGLLPAVGRLGQLRHAAVDLRPQAGIELAGERRRPSVTIAAPGTTVLPVGLVGRRCGLPRQPVNAAYRRWLVDEYILSVPVTGCRGARVAARFAVGPAAVLS